MDKFSLFYPIKPFSIFQNFGESLACVEDKPNLPVTKRKVVGKVNGVCPIGYIELYPVLGMKGHNGLDCYAIGGAPLYATVDGVVKEIETEVERGLGVGIISNEKYNFGEKYGYAKVRYWHLKTISVSMDQKVNVGDIIGLADNTGLSSGDHLHFELKPVDYFTDGKHYNLLQNNGFYGAIDPVPYFNKIFASDAQKIINILRGIVLILNRLVGLLKK